MTDDQLRDRGIRLFTFLKELAELRTKTVRVLDDYEKVLWLHQVPQETGCGCIAWPDQHRDPHPTAETPWVEVKKPRMRSPPDPPPAHAEWFDKKALADSTGDRPDVRPRIPQQREEHDEGPPLYLELETQPQIRAALEYYIEGAWLPWAHDNRRKKSIQQVYNDLFSIYQSQKRLGEEYEVVLGLGLLSWKAPGDYSVRRHLLTTPVTISFDATKGYIAVLAPPQGAVLSLEQDMLEAQHRPDPATQNNIESTLLTVGDLLWDGQHIPDILKSWVNSASSEGRYENELYPESRSDAEPVVCLAPAIILRRRTEQRLLRAY